MIFTSKTILNIFTVISSKLVPDLNFGSTQFTRNPYARWFPINLANFQTAVSRERFDLRNWNKHQIKDVDLLFLLMYKTLTFDLWNLAYAKSPLFDLLLTSEPGQSIFGPKLTLTSEFDHNWTFTLIFISKTLLNIFTVISSKLVPDLNFGSTQFTRNPYARWFPINLSKLQTAVSLRLPNLTIIEHLLWFLQAPTLLEHWSP